MALEFDATATPSSSSTHRTLTMTFQLRSLAAAFGPKSRLGGTDEEAPKAQLKMKPTPGWSRAWQTCRRKAAHLNLRPRRFSGSSFTSSSSKRTSRVATPSSLSSVDSTAKPVPQVECAPRPAMEHVASTPSVSAASDDDEAPLRLDDASGQVVYRRRTAEARFQTQEAPQSRFVEAETDGPERPSAKAGGKPRAGVLAHSSTEVSATSDYDASLVDDGSCYGSFTTDRRRAIESYLEMQAETERSFIDRW